MRSLVSFYCEVKTKRAHGLTLIISGIFNLCQYLFTLQLTPEDYRPTRCPCCGMAGLHGHGSYTRKANRRGVVFETDQPIVIPRFICPHCRTTCSCLPEAIPPRRHYLWCWQQLVLQHWLAGMSLNAIAKRVRPDRKTIKRWLDQLEARFALDASALRNRFAELGRSDGFKALWRACLAKIPLSTAMYHIHNSGMDIP